MQEQFAVRLTALNGRGGRVEVEIDAAPFEGGAQALRHVAVKTGQHFAHKFNDRDL